MGYLYEDVKSLALIYETAMNGFINTDICTLSHSTD